MSQKPATPNPKTPAERVVRDIRRATRKHYSAGDKIRIVLEGLRGEESIAVLCRREGIAESLYYTWKLLCWSRAAGGRVEWPGLGTKIAVDLPGDVALETANDVGLVLPFSGPSADVVEGRLMAA